MAWIEWHQRVLPTTDELAEIECHIENPGSLAPAQTWTLTLDHFVRNPEIEVRGGLELMLAIEVGNLGFQVTDWRHIGRQDFTTTPEWHATAETMGPYGNIRNTWLSVRVMEHHHGSGRLLRREWLADYYRVTFSPPNGFLFPCEIEAWLMPEESFHTGAALKGIEVQRIPQGPPNLRIITLARFTRGGMILEAGHPDPIATARQRLDQTLCLDEIENMSLKWWAETERSLKKIEGPVPDNEKRLSEVTFFMPKPEAPPPA